MATKLKKLLITVAALAALALGGAALAGAASGGSDPVDTPGTSKAITGEAKAKAEQAALAKTGGGKLNQTELDNENGATYEVEVTKTDGSTVDVRLGDRFDVIAVESDTEKPGDE